MSIVIITVVIMLIAYQIISMANLSSLKNSYIELDKVLGDEVVLRTKYSKNSKNQTYYIEGQFKEAYQLEVNNYFDASSSTKSKTFIHLSPKNSIPLPKIFLIPAKNRRNSSLGGTKFITLNQASSKFKKSFALATDDEPYIQSLFSKPSLLEAVENTPILRKGFLIVDEGKIQFTLQRSLRSKKDPEMILNLLNFMKKFYESIEQHKKE